MNLSPALRPTGPVPTDRQLAWHRLELYGFIHFTVNTFTDKEWGYGDESPSTFNPSAFDADQIVETAARGGLKGLILTCKHHDGFCLWPTRTTAHSVASSAWQNGTGNAVKAVSEACARHGLKFGAYLSPWDRNNPAYGTPDYLSLYRRQLTELMSDFGPLFEVWFDGANGGDGYYGGAREKRSIDPQTYYDWETTWALVRERQPQACMFSDVGPDIRWVGNEQGFAGDPCWSTMSTSGFAPGLADTKVLNRGQRDGDNWLPAEVDVSIRPGWFYHAAEDDRVRTPDNLLDLYFKSVGRGASLLINLPPDRRGLIHDADRNSLIEFKRRLDALLAVNLASGATLEGAALAGDTRYAPGRLVDGQPDTFWCPGDHQPAEVLLTFPQPIRFGLVGLREHLPLGQRVDAFAVDAWDGAGYREVVAAEAIGNRRLLRIPTITTNRVRLRILKSTGCPALTEFSLHPGES
jgi:alpha-L-fucosidase